MQHEVDGEVKNLSVGYFSYGKMKDRFVVPTPCTVDFQRQYKLSMKPATQVGIDADQNVLTTFPFNVKGMRRSEIMSLAKTTQRCSLSLSHRVTFSSNTSSVVYKFSECSEETSAVTLTTTTAGMFDDVHPQGQRCEHCSDGSDSDTSAGVTSDEETKSLSVVPDSNVESSDGGEDEDSNCAYFEPTQMVDDGSVSPVFSVKAPSSFYTEYPEDNSHVFTAQGLVEVDQLGSPHGDCSEELFSDADHRDNVMAMQTENAQGYASDSTVTKTFPEDISDLDIDETHTEPVSEITIPDNGKTPPAIDYAAQEGRNKRQLDPMNCPFKKHFKTQAGNTNDNKSDYFSTEHCPFKKQFKIQPGAGTIESNCDDSVGDQSLPNINTGDGHNNLDTHTNSDSSWSGKLESQPGAGTIESNCDDSVGDQSLPNIITFNKKYFIVQDIGVREMVAEGKSNVHIRVRTKSEFKHLIQRLIVKVGQNKS